MSETFFCRLCLVSTENYQLLDGELIDIVDDLLLQNKSLKSTIHIVCVNCVTKIHKAFEFKSTCMNTKVTLSHYAGPQENAKLDLKMIYLVEKEPGKEIYSYEGMKICRTCLNMIESGLYACLLDAIKFNGLEDIFKLYIPDLMLTLTESPLICEKCINNFRCFSEIISTFLDTENRIKGVCEQTKQGESNALKLDEILDPSEDIKKENDFIEDDDESKIIFEFEHLPMHSYSNSNKISRVEENEEKIMKMIIKEDTDLFYKEQPDYDSENDTFKESVNDSDQQNIVEMEFINPKNITNHHYTDFKILGIDEIHRNSQGNFDNDSSPPSNPEEAPSNIKSKPKKKKPKKLFKNRRKKKKQPIKNQPRKEQLIKNQPRKKQPIKNQPKKKQPHKQPKKKQPHKQPVHEISEPTYNIESEKPPKKCRRVYGLDHKELWCTQCRWKKACERFPVPM